MDLPPRPEMFDFHGVPMTHYLTDNWENIQNFQARPDDIFIASYPKAGNTWVSFILDQLHFGQTSKQIHLRVPNLEFAMHSLQPGPGPTRQFNTGTGAVNDLQTSPRLIRTHLPLQFMPKSVWEQNCRIVYVARNAKDSVVSLFHFETMAIIYPDPGDWSTFPQRFMEGKTVYGPWYDHVNSWWKKKQTHAKLHFMFYEDLLEDTGREIEKLCCFLGLSPSPEEKESILDRVQFDKMKANDMVNHSLLPLMDSKISSFIRKGKVGDWKNHFTVAQNEEFEEDYKKKMKDPTLQFLTKISRPGPAVQES